MSFIGGLQREQNIKSSPGNHSDTWTTISFNFKIGLSLYFGLALLLIALLVAFGILTIWLIPQWGQTNLQSNLVRAVILVWIVVLPMFGGLFFVAMGLSDKNRKVVLDQTQLVFDPLFWREKIGIRYEQIEQIVWYYKQRSPERVDRIGIEVRYFPINSNQQIDESRFYKLVITGISNQEELFEELQKRRKGMASVNRVPVFPSSPNRILLVVIAGSLFFCPILLLVLIELMPIR